MKQYPHFLFVKTVTESVQDPDTGNWSDPVETMVLHSECREQTNGRGTMINGSDGKAILFSSVIHLPLSAGVITEGTEVFVSEDESGSGRKRISGQVLKFDKGQLHNRLWV